MVLKGLLKTVLWAGLKGAKGYHVGDQGISGLIPGRNERFVCSPQHSDRLWDPLSLLSNWSAVLKEGISAD
jgi:hypothetical protein